MTPDGYTFSIKLNKLITHLYRLELNKEVREKVDYILSTTQVLKEKLGAILIQLPASFHLDKERLEIFLGYFVSAIRALSYQFDVAIEFRHASWFVEPIYNLLEKYNVALVAGQSSRWIGVRHLTANVAYIRMHGPAKLFASLYSTEELTDWAAYIQDITQQVRSIYVYFNNDFHGYALKNAQELKRLLSDLNK